MNLFRSGAQKLPMSDLALPQYSPVFASTPTFRAATCLDFERFDALMTKNQVLPESPNHIGDAGGQVETMRASYSGLFSGIAWP